MLLLLLQRLSSPPPNQSGDLCPALARGVLIQAVSKARCLSVSLVLNSLREGVCVVLLLLLLLWRLSYPGGRPLPSTWVF